MNLITVIIIAIVIWLVYSLIQSYRNLEKELREIRAKCIGVNNTTTTSTTSGTTETMSISPTQTKDNVVGKTTEKQTSSNVPANTSAPSGAYTPTGDQLYSTDNNSTLYDNDPLSSMRKTLVSGLNSIKTAAMI